ncbi:hypothetical protein ACP275_10G094200 [Erythranthe tilingii]
MNQQYLGFEGKTRFQEKTEESEAVDELIQILVECLKEADIRTREVLLRKCFFEIEKEIPLERFLVDRIKQSRVKLLSDLIEKIQWRERIFSDDEDGDVCKINNESDRAFATRELVELSSDSEKMERFKVRTVKIGEVVKEEPATSS